MQANETDLAAPLLCSLAERALRTLVPKQQGEAQYKLDGQLETELIWEDEHIWVWEAQHNTPFPAAACSSRYRASSSGRLFANKVWGKPVCQPASVGKGNLPRSLVEGADREASFNSLVLLLTQLAEEANAVKIHWVSRTVCKNVLWDIWKEGHGLHHFHSWRVSYRGQSALA